MSEKFRVGSDIVGFENNGSKLPISRVTLFIDDETVYTAGDDTGSELTARCDFATQEMAEAILNKVRGFVYTAYSAEAANLDPAAELGDGVTVGGVYSFISRVEDDGNGYPNIEAPGEKLIDEEFPFESPTTAEMKRKLAETRAQFKILHDEISSEIKALEDDVDGKYTKLTQTVDSFTFEDEDGTVKIDGGVVDASGLKVDAANVTGTLTIGQLPSSVAETSDIPSKVSQLTNDSGYQTKSGVTTIVNGTVTTDYINALDITATNISGGFIAGDDMQLDGELDVYEAITPYRYGGKVGFYTGSSGSGTLSPGVALKAGSPYNVCMVTDSGAAIASGSGAKVSVYGTTASIAANSLLYNGNAIHTSDRNVKHDINYNLERYEAMYNALKPCSYKYDYGTSNRDHTGFIAQDFKDAIVSNGLTTEECAAYVDITDESQETFGKCGLRYEEVISLNTWQIQKLKAENAEIKSRLLKLEEKLTKMGV